MSTTTVPSAMKSRCAHCSAPAYVKCSGCSSPLDNEVVTITYYCDKKCQSEHRAIHKSACKTHQIKKLLHRAGEMLRGIFHGFRQEMFNNKIVKVEHKDGKLYIVEGQYPAITSSLDVLHESFLNCFQAKKTGTLYL